jgi:hypothetical protein
MVAVTTAVHGCLQTSREHKRNNERVGQVPSCEATLQRALDKPRREENIRGTTARRRSCGLRPFGARAGRTIAVGYAPEFILGAFPGKLERKMPWLAA